MSPPFNRSLWSRLGNIRRRHRAVTKGSGVVFTRTAQPDSLAPQNAGAKSGVQRLVSTLFFGGLVQERGCPILAEPAVELQIVGARADFQIPKRFQERSPWLDLCK